MTNVENAVDDANAGQKVLVIGGTGFVGRHVCAALARHGARVVVSGRRSPRIGSFVRLDLARFPIARTSALLHQVAPDAVVNCTGSIWGQPHEAMHEAVALPSLNLVSAMERLPRSPRLVHLGSVLEVGARRPGEVIGPDTVPNDLGAYGAAKLEATRRVEESLATGRLHGLVLRVANACGPGTPKSSLLGRVAQQLLGAAALGGPPTILDLGRLTARRDYVDVRDVAEAVALAARSPATGALADIGCGEAVAVRDLVTSLVRVSGRRAAIADRHESLGHSREDFTRVDASVARDLLGWQPRISLDRSIADHWDDLVLNADRTSSTA